MVSLQKRLRDYVVARMHTGTLQPGDQLPTYRELSQRWSVDHRMIARAYRILEAEGLVEVRGRAGVFLQEQERIGGELPSETARWVASEVLTSAWQRRIKIPELPQMIQKCTASVKLRTACIESNEDHRHLLCRELRDWFGFQTVGVPTHHLPDQSGASQIRVLRINDLPEAVRAADVMVTTMFHAHEVRTIAEVLGKPYVVVSMPPVAAEMILGRIRRGPLTVICADPSFGERMRTIAGAEYQDRIRVVLARDKKAVRELDPDEPVFITTAARSQLAQHPPSIMKDVPAFSTESAAELALLLIRLNLEASEQQPRDVSDDM